MSGLAISPAEFTERMREIFSPSGYDLERAHGEADDLLCELLRQLGCEEGVKVFEDSGKWYA